MKKSQKGFTIIEVALVLAIGALIFLVVFLAVPALQRNQRNDARKRDVSSVVQAMADYNSNNPTTALPVGTVYDGAPEDTSLGKYMDQLSNNTTTVIVKDGAAMTKPDEATDENSDVIYVYLGKKCDGNETLKDGAKRGAAVVGTVENPRGYSHYCSDAN